ncbi:E-beta-farnesene synthase [Tanacetum coccineum]|uniref:E-beta-farnesene synthase n=1 Tax=Tanacetum coccineum TaxID=301880 RepID=A0ABQ5G7Q4_9ASTR
MDAACESSSASEAMKRPDMIPPLNQLRMQLNYKDDIYEIDLSLSNTNDSSMYAISNKRAKLDLDFTLLWHCRLGHISKKRIEKLQYDGLLNSTDIKSSEKCVSYRHGIAKEVGKTIGEQLWGKGLAGKEILKEQSISLKSGNFGPSILKPTRSTMLSPLEQNHQKQKTNYKKKANEPVTPSTSKTAPASKGSQLKSPVKVAKTDKKKQPATMQKTKGLVVLSEVALTEAEQTKLATKRSKTPFHSSYTSGLGAGVRPEVPNVPKYTSESEEESWTFSQDNEDDAEESNVNDDSEETESDNDGDNLTHPNLSTYKANDQEEKEVEANDDEVSSDQRVSTPPEYELTKEEKENKEGDDKDKEGEQKQDDKDDLYRDVNINLERNDAEMTDAQANKDTKDAHFINPSPDIKTPSSDTTIPQPPFPIIQPLQQTPETTTTTTTTTNLIMTLLDIPNFASLFWFEQRVSALETEMSEFKQTNQFTNVVSFILDFIDNYLASKMKEPVDVAVQL